MCIHIPYHFSNRYRSYHLATYCIIIFLVPRVILVWCATMSLDLEQGVLQLSPPCDCRACLVLHPHLVCGNIIRFRVQSLTVIHVMRLTYSSYIRLASVGRSEVILYRFLFGLSGKGPRTNTAATLTFVPLITHDHIHNESTLATVSNR